MKNEAFVLVSETSIEFFPKEGKSLKKVFCIDDYNNFEEYVAAVISSFAKNCENNVSTVKLVLPSIYYNYGEQVVPGARSMKGEKYKIRNFSSPLSSVCDTDTTSYFEVNTDYECEGKSCKRLEEIPLLRKYLKRKTFLYWDSHRLSSLVSQLSQLGIEVVSVVPDTHLYNSASKSYCGNNAIVSIFDRVTEICIFSGGHIRRIINLQFGLFDVVRRLSNVFGLSYNNCRTLVEMYGFVSVPQQFVHYQIAVPVFDEIRKNVKLTDISYEIQDILKKQFTMLYAEIKDYEIKEVVFKGMPVVDAHVLFQMMTNFDCNCFNSVSYKNLDSLFNVLADNSYSETLVAEPVAEEKTEAKAVNVVSANETTTAEPSDNHDIVKNLKPAWVDSIMSKLYQSRDKINSLMLE
jgi:hypothetical protein